MKPVSTSTPWAHLAGIGRTWQWWLPRWYANVSDGFQGGRRLYAPTKRLALARARRWVARRHPERSYWAYVQGRRRVTDGLR